MAFTVVRGFCLQCIKCKRKRICFILGCLCVCSLIVMNSVNVLIMMKGRGLNQRILSEYRDQTNATQAGESVRIDRSAEEGTNTTASKMSNNAILKLGDKQQHHIIPDIDKTIQKPVSTTRHTLEGMKQLAKTDKHFLARIMDQDYLLSDTKRVLERYLLDHSYDFVYNATLKTHLNQNFSIDTDVMVFLHIQKTGGNHFNDRVKRELQKPFACKCMSIKLPKGPCNCVNPQRNMWFYTTVYSGWQCGLHADWTVMHTCIPSLVDKVERKRRLRRYFYFTQLRDAVERYMSEYNHQTAHNHWQAAILGCGNTVNANKHEVKPCFRGKNWKGVTLDGFMACEDNLATHRMTRMLADLTLAGCYSNFTDRNTLKAKAPIWLQSAKNNLQTMEYIGLMEDEPASDKLFYKTYNLKFRNVLKHAESTSTGAKITLTEEQFLKVLRLSELDIHLYLFGKDLFYKRLKEVDKYR